MPCASCSFILLPTCTVFSRGHLFPAPPSSLHAPHALHALVTPPCAALLENMFPRHVIHHLSEHVNEGTPAFSGKHCWADCLLLCKVSKLSLSHSASCCSAPPALASSCRPAASGSLSLSHALQAFQHMEFCNGDMYRVPTNKPSTPTNKAYDKRLTHTHSCSPHSRLLVFLQSVYSYLLALSPLPCQLAHVAFQNFTSCYVQRALDFWHGSTTPSLASF